VAAEFKATLAREAAEREAAVKRPTTGEASGTGASGNSGGGSSSTGSGVEPSSGGDTAPASKPPATAKKTTFFGTVDIDPIKAKLQFSDVAEEVLMLFTQRLGVKVRVSLEIEAEAPGGFDDGVQRSVRENCNQLKFKNHEFGE
jgi:hypothetical protein